MRLHAFFLIVIRYMYIYIYIYIGTYAIIDYNNIQSFILNFEYFLPRATHFGYLYMYIYIYIYILHKYIYSRLTASNHAVRASVLFRSVVPFRSVLFCSVLVCSVLFRSVLFCSVLFCSVLVWSVHLVCSVLV